MDTLKDHSHWAWLAVGIVVVLGILFFTTLIGHLVSHIILWTIIGGIVYFLDFKFTKLLDPRPMQFGVAVVLAVIGGFISNAPLWMVIVLSLCDVVILMCVFSLSARFWPNADAIQERMLNDPLGAARDGLSASADAIKQGMSATQEETTRLGGHFRPQKPAT